MSDMKIESKILKVDEFLKDGYFYEIPDFQRPYSWKDGNLDDFIKDIENIVVNDGEGGNVPHFMGSIISYENDFKDPASRAAGTKRRCIVDGQQRITTTLILLSALRDVAYVTLNSLTEISDPGNSIENKKSVDKLTRIVNEIDDQLHPESKFTSIEHRYIKLGYYSSIIDDSTALEPLLKGPEGANKAWQDIYDSILPGSKTRKKYSRFKVVNAYKRFYDYFTERLSELDEIDNKIAYLHDFKMKISLLEYVDILLNNFEAAYSIFMTLNDRGMDLTNADLIKSHINRMTHNNTLGNLDRQWKNVMDILGGSYDNYHNMSNEYGSATNEQEVSEDNFFIAYARVHGFEVSQDSKKALTPKSIFRCYENSLSNADKIDDFMASVEKEAKIFRLSYDPNFYQDSDLSADDKDSKNNLGKVVEPLSALKILNIKQHAIFAYLLLGLCINKHEGYGRPLLTIPDVVKMFKRLENFHFQYNGLFKLPTNKVDYSRFVGKIINVLIEDDNGDTELINKKIGAIKRVLSEMTKYLNGILKDRGIDADKFTEKFISLSYTKSRNQKKYLTNQDYLEIKGFEPVGKDNSFIVYILSKYQPQLNGKPGDYVNIEHIYPRSKGEELADPIGNLMLLHETVNRRLGDKEVKDKLDTLKIYYGEPRFFNISEEWNPENFEGRARKMAKHGYNVIWKI